MDHYYLRRYVRRSIFKRSNILYVKISFQMNEHKRSTKMKIIASPYPPLPRPLYPLVRRFLAFLFFWQDTHWLGGRRMVKVKALKKCDQIGRFFKVVWTNLVIKIAKIFSDTFGLLWKMSLFMSNWCGYFWATFVENWANFYSNIWPHCSKLTFR